MKTEPEMPAAPAPAIPATGETATAKSDPRFPDRYLTLALETTARHEAGHAVMHVFLRLEQIDMVEIFADPFANPDCAGRVRRKATGLFDMAFHCDPTDFPGPWVTQARIHFRKLMLFTLAGPVAAKHRIFGTDRTSCTKLGKRIAGARRKEFESRYVRITKHLVFGVLAPAIDEFTKILLERRSIEGAEATDIILELLGLKMEDFWRVKRAQRIFERLEKPMENAA